MSTARKSTSDAPYAFITRHYRDPGGEDRIRRWLPHPEVARAICAVLRASKDYKMGEPDCAEPHDRVDVGRQVEVLAALFREGLMPPDGVAILEGVAAGFSQTEIAKNLKILRDLVKWRIGEMRQLWQKRMETLGMVPRTPQLRVIVCEPFAMPLLRAAA